MLKHAVECDHRYCRLTPRAFQESTLSAGILEDVMNLFRGWEDPGLVDRGLHAHRVAELMNFSPRVLL